MDTSSVVVGSTKSLSSTKVTKKVTKSWDLGNMLMPSLCAFYKNSDNLEKFLGIVGKSNTAADSVSNSNTTPIDATSPISRRVLDWFVTGYSSRHHIVYDLNDSIFHEGKEFDEIKPFSVHEEYKAQLKSFQKLNFDTFCRRDRIRYYYDIDDDTKYKITTVGQLNFFRWAITNKVIDYVLEYLSEIEEDMNLHTKTKPKKKRTKSVAPFSTSGTSTNGTGSTDGISINKKRIHNISASRSTTKKDTIIRIRFT